MRIAIIGAGFTGLTVALRLSQKGHRITIFEKEKKAGGLAGGFKEKNWAWALDFFYRHLFTNDSVAKKLLEEIGVEIIWAKPKTSVFKNEKIYRFDSPLSILSFPHFSLVDKIRTGLVSLYLKFNSNWQYFEKVTASDWLKKFYGKNVYQLIWSPLLKGKFGPFVNQIPMTWFWARIKKRTPCLGYPQGGFQSLVNKLVEKIKENGGQFYFDKEIENFNEFEGKFDRIIFTTPISIFLKIMKEKLPQDYSKNKVLPKAGSYQKELSKFKMMGSLNLALSLSKKFLKDGTYWLNVNQEGFPFVAVVDHSNFINPKFYGKNYFLYVGGYYKQDHPFFNKSKEDLLKIFLPFLKKINPDFDQSWIKKSYLFKNIYSQPLFTLDYSKNIPSLKTPIKNVFLGTMQQIYPWDRGVNYAIEMGEKLAKLVNNEKI